MRELTEGRGEHDLVPGRLRLYRTWRADARHGGHGLMSTAWDVTWPAAHEMTATCVRLRLDEAQHESPTRACTCGIYGWYDPHDTRMVGASVIGVIEAWGHCVLGSNGARVQHAQLLGVAPNPYYPSIQLREATGLIMADLADAGYPTFASYGALLKAFPPVAVRELSGDPMPMGDLLDAQQRGLKFRVSGAKTMAAQMEQLSIAAAQAGVAIGQFTQLARVAALASRKPPLWMRVGMHAQGIAAALLYCAAAIQITSGRWLNASSYLFWGTYSFIAWRTREVLPWRWFRGRGARRA